MARIVGANHDHLQDYFMGVGEEEEQHETVGPPPEEKEDDSSNSDLSYDQMVADEFAALEIDRRLDTFGGLCVQRRFLRWTYEWCYEGQVHRFHLTSSRSIDPLLWNSSKTAVCPR